MTLHSNWRPAVSADSDMVARLDLTVGIYTGYRRQTRTLRSRSQTRHVPILRQLHIGIQAMAMETGISEIESLHIYRFGRNIS